MFYPKDRWVTVDQEDGTKVEIADGIPWYFYLSHTASPNPTVYPDGFSWTLRDVTAPKRPQVSYEPNAFERVLRTSRGRTVDQPPIELFGKLNDALVFPKGVVYWKMPDGSTWSLETTEPWSLSDWLTAIGLGLAGLGLILATGGLASPGVLAALGIASAGFSIASTVADLSHRSELGILTAEDRNRAILFIAADIASALSLGLGHAAAELTRAGVAAGRITRLTIIIRRAATAAAIADKALGGAVLVTMSADFIQQYQAIMSSNLSGPEREQALGELAGQALLTGAIVVAPHAVEAVAARVRKRAGAGEPLGGAGRDPLGLTAGRAGEPVATVTQLEREPGHGWAGGRSDAEGKFVDWSAKQATLPPEQAAHELQIAQSAGREHPMDKETGYVRDLELEGHNWQEKADGSGWCRLSTRKCYSSTQLKVGSKGSAERTTAATVQDVAARRAELAHPPSPRPQGTTGRDWADYVFYANRRLNAIEEALRAGQKPKTPPRTFQSFVTEHPPGSPVRNEIQGTQFEQRTRAEAEKALGKERAQLLLSQANLSEVLNPTVAEGELTRPDLLIPDRGGTRTAVSNKSRVSMESMTPAAAEKQVIFDLTEARVKYTGEKYVRRTGEKADITRVWLLYDAAGVPEKLRPVVRKAVADYQRLHPELRFEVGIF